MTDLRVQIRRKVYRGATGPALEGLDFCVRSGEIVAVVGPSGSGKSTLLNIVAGIDREVEGSVEIDGRPGPGERPDAKGHTPVRLGMMFQASRLMPWLTVLDNLRLVLGRSPESTARARRVLREVGLDDVEGDFPGQLSGGMQRRVALARAVAVEPSLLLLDEPLVSLDAPTATRLRRHLLAYCQERHPTVLYVTHELREALAVCDRVLFLSARPGRLVLELPVELPRPRELDDALVGEAYDRLLGAHPEILAGHSNSHPGPSRAMSAGDPPPRATA